MHLGASQLEITPPIGVELSGFAVREQPSTGVLDPLWARALFLRDSAAQLLWIHCDLIGFDEAWVAEFRTWAGERCGLTEEQIVLSATHTHSGPCTIHLAEAGRYDDFYARWLMRRVQSLTLDVMRTTQECVASLAEEPLALAVDRRSTPVAPVDSRLGVVAFHRSNGVLLAAVVNYAVHPVALGPRNRQISGDLYGLAATQIRAAFPSAPVVLMTNGACGELNPPAVDVDARQLEHWTRQIATAAVTALTRAADQPGSPSFRVCYARCPLPLEQLDVTSVNVQAARASSDMSGGTVWREKAGRAAEAWKRVRLAEIERGEQPTTGIVEMLAVELGGAWWVGVNAELFTAFLRCLRARSQVPVYVLGYVNGDLGYLFPRNVYHEGGYEVDLAHLFYGRVRFAPGALERLTDEVISHLKISSA